MGIEFDPINKYIKITSPTTELTALEIYNAAMDWCDDQPTIGYSVPMKASGKFTLGGGAYSDSIFILQNGWKIKFWDGTYQATITGTLITEDATPRTVPPDSGNVEIVFQVSSQATVIEGAGGVEVWTEVEKDGVVEDVFTVKGKTANLPIDPASESGLIDAVDLLLANHLSHLDIPTEKKKPKSIAQVLEEELNP